MPMIRAVAPALLLLLASTLSSPAAHAALTSEQQLQIQASTFEVVVAKPVDDPLSYERKLPFELELFQYRNDKFLSIGTAFALDGHRYATAAHVLGAVLGSQWGAPALRDAKGQVFPIDQILKYSVDQDFAEFSLKTDPGVAPLAINTQPVLNSVVYAAGNALGTGVVIRDGLYTSDTPEEQDGRWKFIRFSAAASPGNSGGPLLDADGRIIGIVLRKSANENLNFALPIQRLLDAPDHLATADQRETFQLDVLDARNTDQFKLSLPLPKSVDAFAAALLGAHDAYSDAQLATLLRNNEATLFPRTEKSSKVLQSMWTGSTPGLIVQAENGEWTHTLPRNTSRTELGHNGYAVVGLLKSNIVAHLRRPDDLDAATLYSDSRKFMDLLLPALSLKRTVGPEQIRITSLGAATQDRVFADHYGRRWQVRTWPTPVNDRVVIVFALPVPDGYALLSRISPTRLVHENSIDLQAIADYAYPNYVGTLKQWREYLKVAGPLLPTPLRDVQLDIGDGSHLRYRSARLAFELPADVLAISDESNLELDLSYFRDHGKVVWDVAGIELYENAHSSNGVEIVRHPRPSEDLNESYFSTWNKLVHRQHPYDAVAANDGDITDIRATAPTPVAVDHPDFVYSLRCRAEGAPGAEKMKARLDRVLSGLTVLEHVP